MQSYTSSFRDWLSKVSVVYFNVMYLPFIQKARTQNVTAGIMDGDVLIEKIAV